ncbi:AIPR family protein [Bacillus badius]|uniref:Abortive infection phage resistance protein n=1 Tax=Bacillus badius TaxID=1455 RepID=A0ABR5AZW2_BACBA|nr:AIPR family protein [Bacillus badius]KIL80160.1 putative abortive infection phage resistance protein [Bacillus badius]MED4718398.1 AIPR family protein [Bacillus badius]
MDGLINEYYEVFKGLPNYRPIVRNNITEDAFTIAVLDIMYKEILNLDFTATNVESLAKYIVAPPDGGIDIFIEYEDGDEYRYDIIQVKYTTLGQQDIKQCLAMMQRTIKDYLKDPQSVHKNLREVISNTNFDGIYKNNCTYYVIHNGDLNYASGLKKSEKIVTSNELKILQQSFGTDSVPEEILKSDGFNNFISYNHNSDENTEEAYLCNLSGYDLAKLNNKYASTELGKNILFGQNLRDSLENKSKTYHSMKQTIDHEPEKFWFYNNGITIIAEGFTADAVPLVNEENNEQSNKKIDSVTLQKFSIINGAQTTSSLGIYLKEAEIDRDEDKINNLKNVYVLTRILVINKSELKNNISIYNNMQNPITSRDMVSNRPEQKKLYEWLISGDKPNIHVEIRRGSNPPSHLNLLKHQSTTNEALAQLAFASFYREPYTAKDKKRTLFNNDYSKEEFTINEDYHKIFNFHNENDKCGILFKKTKSEIDELLFVAHLYKESKKYLKKEYELRLEKQYTKLKSADEDEHQNINDFINNYKTQIAINNICFFYCMALYYEFKAQFDEDNNKTFNYSAFYDRDPQFKQNLIENFTQLFLTKTIEIIKNESAGTANVSNWIRSKKSEDLFMKKLRQELAVNLSFSNQYKTFIDQFKH